eukprot:jgi/Tetstr1/443250/TSEL_031285.t1
MPSRSATLTASLVVGATCLLVVCYNLGAVQHQMEAAMHSDPQTQRVKLAEGLQANIDRVVVRQAESDISGIIDKVKLELASDVDAAMARETDAAVASVEHGLDAGQGKAPAPPLPNQATPGGRLAWFGKEDLDEAVERRIAELEAEEKVNPHVKHGYFLEWASPSPPWPHQKIKTILKRDTGVIGLCAPFIKYYYNSEYEKATFWRLKADGHIVVGVSSYEFFPGNATNPYTDRAPQQHPENKKIYAAADGWLHCFRNPSDHLAPGVPRAMISQSDFIDPAHQDLIPKGLPKKHLFAYSDLSGDWNDFNRNWTVAKECVKVAVANNMGSMVLIGKKKDENNTAVMGEIMPFVREGKVVITDMLPHTELTNTMEQSEFFFVPNQSDASPRVAVEAMLRGTPLIMNKHISGGWKYINDQTGVFFDGAKDFLPAIQRLRALRDAGKLRPREWFMEHYGPRKASLRLQAFIELAVGKERLAKANSLPRARW